VDLGGFRQYVHRHDPARRLEWSAEIDTAPFQSRIAEFLAPANAAIVSIEIGLEQVETGISREVVDPRTGKVTVAEFPTGELVPAGPPHVQHYEIIIDGRSILRMSRRPDGNLQMNRLDHQHPVFRGVIKAIVEIATTTESLTAADYEGVVDAIAELVPGIVAQPGKFLPTGLLRAESASLVSEQAPLFPISRGRRQEDLARALRRTGLARIVHDGFTYRRKYPERACCDSNVEKIT